MLPDGFHFLRPHWLWLLPVCALLGAWLWRRTTQMSRQWEKACDPHLLKYLTLSRPGTASRWPEAALLSALALLVLALAGPVFQQLPQPVYQSQAARVLILDLSLSMDSPDLAPSRLQRARYKLLDILSGSEDAQVGLVVYADDAFVVSPLTHDADTIAAMVPSLATDIMPVQGDRAARALEVAAGLLENSGLAEGDILLISDGVGDQGSVVQALQGLSSGYRLSVLAVGTAEGAPIPLPEGGFVTDQSGRVVMPGVATASLQDLARLGGGRFASLSGDNRDLQQVLLAPRDQRDVSAAEATERQADVWREEGPWLVLLALPLVALAFRRGWLALVVLACGLEPPPVMALSWDDLWLRDDQQAALDIQAGDAKSAAGRFRDPAWNGVAAYRAGDYPAAVDSLAGLDTALGHYNRGNALARAGNLHGAVAAYQQALEREPTMQDAEFNRRLVDDLLQQQARDQQSQGDGQGESREQPSQEQPSSGQGQSGGAQQDADPSQAEQNSGSSAGSESTEPQSADPGEQEPSAQEGGGDRQQKAAPGAEQQEQPGAEQQQAGQAAENARQEAGDPGAGKPAQMARSEADQALEQWLRRIPDEPGGLLKQKLILEHMRRQREQR